MKHRELTRSTAWKAGYTAPSAPRSNKGGGYPHHQPFDGSIVGSNPKRKK